MLILMALTSGGMLARPMLRGAGGGTLTAQGAVQLINRERAVLVDVREPEEFAGGHMIGAKNVPLNLLEEKLAGTVKNKNVPLLLVCATGARAQRAVATAKKLGYEQAQAVAGGLKAWKEANLPVEKA
ncbi:rhodanese-like domain-containing protein [Variovorax boronicumulans]